MRRRAKRRTTTSGQPAAEDGGASWQQPTAPAASLGPTSDGPSLGRFGLAMAEDEAWYGAVGDGGAAGMAAVARQSGVRHGMEALWGMAAAARRSCVGGRNHEASGEFLSQREMGESI
jgi:hypothetical protein